MDMRRAVRLAALALASLWLGGCANEVTDVLIEQPLGALSELAVRSQFSMERDPLLHGFVGRLGAENKRHVRRKDVPYRFSVVDNEAPNAFAIPYGGIYVTKGLLRFADSEDEIGFVVAHEVGHVERRHSSLAFQRNVLVTVGLALATNERNQNWMQLAYVGNTFLDLHFSRQNEMAADREGALHALNGGLDPASGIDFFRRLDERYGATPRFWGYFQTHPINKDRISELQRTPQLSKSDPAMLTSIGEGYRRRAQYRAAEHQYRQALSTDPHYGAAYAGLARVSAWRGEGILARHQWEQARARGYDDTALAAEAGAWRDRPDPEPRVVLASRRSADDARAALARSAEQTSGIDSEVTTATAQPLDAVTALVNGHQQSGARLDALLQMGDKLPHAAQETVASGQKLRGLALNAATDFGEAQNEARDVLAQLADNRARLAARLQGTPTAAAAATAQRVAAWDGDAARWVESAVTVLKREAPKLTAAVEQSHQAIALLSQELRSGPSRGALETTALANMLNLRLDQAQSATTKAVERAQQAINQVRKAKAQAVLSSIDITLLERQRCEREAAAQLTEHLFLAGDGQVRGLLDDGFTFGEASYVLGLAKSSNTPAPKLLEKVDAQQRHQVVEQLDRGQGSRPGNVAIILRLLDRTLRREYDPPAAKAPSKPPSR